MASAWDDGVPGACAVSMIRLGFTLIACVPIDRGPWLLPPAHSPSVGGCGPSNPPSGAFVSSSLSVAFDSSSAILS